MRREHSRCGTTFLFFVVAVSIMVFVLINVMIEKCGLFVTADQVSEVGAKFINGLIKSDSNFCSCPSLQVLVTNF